MIFNYDVSDVKDTIQEYAKTGNRVLEVIKDSYYAVPGGAVIPYSGWDRTDLIYIGDCNQIEIYLSTASDYVVLFDEDKHCFGSMHVNSGRNVYGVSRASYIGISASASAMSSCELKAAFNPKRVVGFITPSSLTITVPGATSDMIPANCMISPATNIATSDFTVSVSDGTVSFSSITLLGSCAVDMTLIKTSS